MKRAIREPYPLFDAHGQVRAWHRGNWLYSQEGEPIAVILGEGIFRVSGRLIGFIKGENLLDLQGLIIAAPDRGGALCVPVAQPRRFDYTPAVVPRDPVRPRPISKYMWSLASWEDWFTSRDRGR